MSDLQVGRAHPARGKEEPPGVGEMMRVYGCRPPDVVSTNSTTSTVDLPPSKEVADLIERLGYMNGVEALRVLSRQVWWVQQAVLWHVGRGA